MTKKYPGRMTLTQWRRTPFRKKHRLVGIALNNHLRYWRDCADARCRRARSCQDFECYWRRMAKLPTDDAKVKMRSLAAPWTKLLWIGSAKGSEGRMLY
jgi:hypothetical protein